MIGIMALLRWLATMALLIAVLQSANAAEVALRMRGGTFEVRGDLKSYNLRTYVIVEPSLGTLTLDAGRYECLGPNCPTGAIEAQAPLKLPFEQVTSTWVGGTAIGTELMPRVIQAYAKTIGASVTSKVGADVRNLEFTLTAADGRKIGQVNIHRQGITPGFLAMAKGEADVVWTSRPILPEEEQMMESAGTRNMRSPGNEHVFGLDALVILVAKENPAVSLSVDSIAKIFSGQIKDWAELGLPQGKINVYAAAAEMGTMGSFEMMVLAPRNLKLTPDAVRLSHATEWSDKVAADPLGISFATLAYVRRARALNVETTCGIVVPPSVFGAKTEEYPLTRRLYFYSAGRPKNPLAAALLDFANSSQMQPIMRDARFVDQDAEFLSFRDQRGRIATALNAPGEDYDAVLMAQMIEETVKAQRSSLTFRFVRGSAQLDSIASENLSRLVQLLQSDKSLAGKTLMLLGFSDAVGRFDSNLNTARRRTTLVKNALLRALPQLPQSMTILERAYGELAPVACNDTEVGRALNRRVEVWIR